MKYRDVQYIKETLSIILSNQAFILARLDEVVNLANIALLHQLPQQQPQFLQTQESIPEHETPRAPVS